jgi:hypothetical protein
MNWIDFSLGMITSTLIWFVIIFIIQKVPYKTRK